MRQTTVPRENIDQLLDRLDNAKRQFEPHSLMEIARLLAKLSRLKIKDAEWLLRYHELLLFVRAYPPGAEVLRLAEKELKAFAGRVELLRTLDVDLSVL